MTEPQMSPIKLDERRRHIYFMSNGKAIKIGIATNVKSRRSALQQDGELQILSTFPGTRLDEKVLHEHFKHLRIKGEWFQNDPAIPLFIERLVRGRKAIENRWANVRDAVRGEIPVPKEARKMHAREVGAALVAKFANAPDAVRRAARRVELSLGLASRVPKMKLALTGLAQELAELENALR